MNFFEIKHFFKKINNDKKKSSHFFFVNDLKTVKLKITKSCKRKFYRYFNYVGGYFSFFYKTLPILQKIISKKLARFWLASFSKGAFPKDISKNMAQNFAENTVKKPL